MILLGCQNLKLLISKFDNQTINGIHYTYQNKTHGIQALFDTDAENEEDAILCAKQLMHTDPELAQYMCSAMPNWMK